MVRRKQEEFDVKTLIIIVLILMILSILLYVYVEEKEENLPKENNEVTNNSEEQNEETNDDKKENTNNEINNQENKKLTINDKIVIDTYKKVPTNTLIPVTIYWKDLTNSVYLSTKQTYETLNNTFVIDNALSFVKDDELTPKINSQTKGPYKLKKSKIKEKIEYLYGSVDFDFNKYNRENGITESNSDIGTGLKFKDLYCNKYVNEEYYCYSFKDNSEYIKTEEYRKLIKVDTKDEYMYLYDYHFTVAPIYAEEGMFTETYSIHVDENAMVGRIEEKELSDLNDKYEGIEKIVKDKKIMYKHTFKKDKSGNYYWISTEQEK